MKQKEIAIEQLRHKSVILNPKSILEFLSREWSTISKDDLIQLIKQSPQTNAYYTPDKISVLISELGKFKKPTKLLDICCGFGNILKSCNYGESIEGIDISGEIIDIAQILNANAKFIKADSLEIEFSSKYDLVFCDPPFGQKLLIEGNQKVSEVAFVEKALSLLNKYGVLICVVPFSFFVSKHAEHIRKTIADSYNLRMIINLPPKVMIYSSINCAILYIENSPAGETVHVYDFKDNSEEIICQFKENRSPQTLKMERFTHQWDISAIIEDELIEEKLVGKEIKCLSEMAEVFNGVYIPKDQRKDKGTYLILGGKNLGGNKIIRSKKDTYINSIEKPTLKKAIACPGDVIISLLFNDRKIYLFTKDDQLALVDNNCAIIRSSNNEYIASYLRTLEGKKLFLKQTTKATKGSIIPRLSIGDLRKIRIPIIPLDNLEKISDAEIEKSSSEELVILKREIKILQFELENQKSKNKNMMDYIVNRLNKIDEVQENSEIHLKLKTGESKRLEFKSTLRMNLKTHKIESEIEQAVLKTIVAFCNTDGGELFIGVNDSGELIGISNDQFPNDDKFLLHLNNIIKQRIKPLVLDLIDMSVTEIRGQKICIIECKSSNFKNGIWLKSLKGQDQYEFYIRSGPSSTPLSAPEAVAYILGHLR